MHVNKVHHVTTINRVASDLGEREGWLSDVANEMDIEDGVIWVYGLGEDGVMAFAALGDQLQREVRTEPVDLGDVLSEQREKRGADIESQSVRLIGSPT